MLIDDVTTAGDNMVDAVLFTVLAAGAFGAVCSATVVVVVAGIAGVGVAIVAAVAATDLLFAVELFAVVSFALVTVELLLLLFACVKLPLITLRGNGFGLIISTKERN